MIGDILSSLGVDTASPNGEALRQLLHMTALGAGAGVAGRSVLGLTKPPDPEGPSEQKPLVVVVPRPKQKLPQIEGRKFASDVNPIADWLDNNLGHSGLSSFLRNNRLLQNTAFDGSDAKNWAEVPWVVPGAIAAVPAATYAGYRGLDSLISSNRKRKADNAIDSAKQEYQNALIQRYSGNKVSSDNLVKMADAIEDLFDLFKKAYDKKAEAPTTGEVARTLLFPGTLAGPIGAGATLASMGMFGGLGGMLGHNYTRDDILSNIKARKLREAEEDAARHTPPVIVAKFVDPDQQKQPGRFSSLFGRSNSGPHLS